MAVVTLLNSVHKKNRPHQKAGPVESCIDAGQTRFKSD